MRTSGRGGEGGQEGQGEEHTDLAVLDASGGAGGGTSRRGAAGGDCRCTPTEDWPFFTKPVSSTTRTAPSARGSSRTASASQRA